MKAGIDEDVDISTDDTNLQGQQDELGASPNFPFGGRSRYGRAVSSIIDSCFKKSSQVLFSYHSKRHTKFPKTTKKVTIKLCNCMLDHFAVKTGRR